ncbi:MAG: hypothetical protein KDK71_00395 [Chlamydiia bacterium]|nr:hypothetical protein [Chlamydiia bacterium]
MVPKAVGSVAQEVFKAAQKAPGGWVASGSIAACSVVFGSYWVLSKGEWSFLSWTNQRVERTNELASKREMPEEKLQRFEDARRGEMANLERIAQELKDCCGFLATEKKALLEEIKKLKESQEKMQALLNEKREELQTLVSALESAISRLSKIEEEKKEVDHTALEVHSATIEIEKEISEVLKELLSKDSGENE